MHNTAELYLLCGTLSCTIHPKLWTFHAFYDLLMDMGHKLQLDCTMGVSSFFRMVRKKLIIIKLIHGFDYFGSKLLKVSVLCDTNLSTYSLTYNISIAT